MNDSRLNSWKAIEVIEDMSRHSEIDAMSILASFINATDSDDIKYYANIKAEDNVDWIDGYGGTEKQLAKINWIFKYFFTSLI